MPTENFYNDEWVDDNAAQMIPLFEEGQSIAEVCAHFGMCKDTYYRLLQRSPKFKEMHDLGIAKSEAWWSKLGLSVAAGKVNIQPATWIFNMKNRFHWKEKADLNIGGQPGNPVGIDDDMDATEAAQVYSDVMGGGQ